MQKHQTWRQYVMARQYQQHSTLEAEVLAVQIHTSTGSMELEDGTVIHPEII
jgi:hypothetical protein